MRQRDRRSSDQRVAVSGGRPCQYQVVGMMDEFQYFLVRHRTVERHGVPVPLVEMVARSDSRITAAQVRGKAWIAFKADAAGCRAERQQREHPAADLEDGHLITEWVVFHRSWLVAPRCHYPVAP